MSADLPDLAPPIPAGRRMGSALGGDFTDARLRSARARRVPSRTAPRACHPHQSQRGRRARASRDRLASEPERPDCSADRVTVRVTAPRSPARRRVRPAVGPCGVLPLHDAPRRLRDLWRARGTGAVGRGQAPADHDLRVVSGALGEAIELARRGAAGPANDVPHLLDQLRWRS